MLPADKAFMQRLGARLRELRERAKLSQDALGERAGFTGKYIGEIEKGIRDIPMSTLRAVAEAGLGLEIDALFLERPSRRLETTKETRARDVEVTAIALESLPLKMRRPFLALVEAVRDDAQPRTAQERRGPKWRRGKRSR